MSQNIDFSKLNIPQLKDHLRGLKAQGHDVKLGGKKAELVYRLQVLYGLATAPPVAPAPAPVVPPTGYAPVVPPTGYAPAVVVQAAQYAPVPQYQMAALPVQPPAAAKPKAPKKPERNPLDVLKSAIRDADQTLSIALASFLDVYNATDRYPMLIEALANLAETKPVALAVPRTADGLRNLKVAELKKILKARGDKVGGKKDELIHRIMNPTPQQVPQGPLHLPPVTPMATGVTDLPPPGVTPFQPLPTNTDAFPGVPGVPGAVPAFPVTTQVPAFPATQVLPVAAASPLAGGVALPTVPGVQAVPALPTAPVTALPTVPVAALPTVPAGSPVATLPTFPAGSPIAALPTFPAGSPNL